MDAKVCYQTWCERLKDDKAISEELQSLSENEILEGFSGELGFGTGGMRGILGWGPNRLNDLTVDRITRAVGRYLQSSPFPQRVVIAYDTRRFSERFAHLVASTLGQMGIGAYVFDEATPTPVLSYAVPEMKAGLGIVITASHNPPQYNGYKVYDHRGVQINPDVADKVTDYYNREDVFCRRDNNVENFSYVDKGITEGYIQRVKGLIATDGKQAGQLKVVYTALHGTGSKPVSGMLEAMGYQVTSIQQDADSNFGGLPSPNPESRGAYGEALSVAKQQSADIILATDPDADRVGVLVRVEDDYQFLNGNQIAAILMHNLIENQKIDKKQAVVTTVVSGELAQVIAQKHGIMVNTTLTGFKYIGDLAHGYQQGNEVHFLFGYEESYGYLTGDFVHDKDAVIASMLIAEVAAKYKAEGKNLYDVWVDLSDQYGWFVEALHTVRLPIVGSTERSKAIMDKLRAGGNAAVGELTVVGMEDYQLGIRRWGDDESELEGYPRSNVLKLYFDDHTWVAVRPSGTEPYIKLYLSANGKDEQEARGKLERLKAIFIAQLDE